MEQIAGVETVKTYRDNETDTEGYNNRILCKSRIRVEQKADPQHGGGHHLRARNALRAPLVSPGGLADAIMFEIPLVAHE